MGCIGFFGTNDRFKTIFLLCLLFLIPLSANADYGITSVNSYVEEKHTATNLCSRDDSCGNGQRSSSGYDFIVVLERENINTVQLPTYNAVNSGESNTSASRNTANFPVNSYLVFQNDDHSNSDRQNKIGQIVFQNKILGIYTSSSNTIFRTGVSKSGATYPTSPANKRAFEFGSIYGNNTSSSTSAGDWISIGSDDKTLRVGTANGQKGDYIRVITQATTDFTINAISNVSVAEGTAYTSVTPALTGSPIGTVTYTLSGADAADFTINSSTGVVSMVARDYDNPVDSGANNTYSLTITATDTYGNNDSEDWVVTVTQVSEGSAFTLNAIADVSVNENAAYTSVTPGYTGSVSGFLTYTITGGTDAADFSINSSTGVVTMVARDFENPVDSDINNTYSLTIRATDQAGRYDTEPWIVTVADVNEPVSFTIDEISNVTINENAAYTSVTPNITGTPIVGVTYTLSGTDAADFTINSSTGVVSMVARDFENPVDSDTGNTYSFTITATDEDANTDTEDWTVTVLNVVEAASFDLDAIADLNINENAAYTSVTPALTGTPIGTVTYTIGGTDAADFTINSSTGVVSMVARDFENPVDSDTGNTYDLVITVTDEDANTDTEDWTVTVVDINEAVDFTIDTISNVTINENTTYTSVTPNITGTPIVGVTYALSGNDSSQFSINSSTGVVTMTGKDYEEPADAGSNNTYSLTITATDTDSNSDTEDWVVTIADVSEAGLTLQSINDVNIDEGASYGSVTPVVNGSPVGAVTYAISGTDAADFSINSSTGVVTMVARDFENPVDNDTNNTYSLTITATDTDSNSDTEDWVVTVVNLGEFSITGIDDIAIEEGTVYTSITPNLTGTPVTPMIYTISGNDADDFSINSSTGVVTMVARDWNNPVDSNSNNTYEITITATDDTGASDTEDWIVTIKEQTLTDPTLKQDVVDSLKATQDIASRWSYTNIDAIHHRLSWLDRNKGSEKTSYQGIKVRFKNEALNSIMNTTPAPQGPLTGAVESKATKQQCFKETGNLINTPTKKELKSSQIEQVMTDSVKQSRDWIKSRDSNHYTLQLDGVATEEAFNPLAKVLYIRNYQALLGLHIFQNKNSGGKWFSVIYGDFETKARALAALKNMPPTLAKLSPQIRSYTAIQQDLFTSIYEEQSDPSKTTSEITPTSMKNRSLCNNSQLQNTAQAESAQGEMSSIDLTSTLQNVAINKAAKIRDGAIGSLNPTFGPLIGNWSFWSSGEITLGKTNSSSMESKNKSLHLGMDKPLKNNMGLLGVALGIGKDKTDIGEDKTKIQSDNYSLSLYGAFPGYNESILEAALGYGHLKYDTTRTDELSILKGDRDANQLYGSLSLRALELNGSRKGGKNSWAISPYGKIDMSYTKFDEFSESGAYTALTFEDQYMINTRISAGADMHYAFQLNDTTIKPFAKLEYGFGITDVSDAKMSYVSQKDITNHPIYNLQTGNASNTDWKIGLGVEVFSQDNLDATLGFEKRKEPGSLNAYSDSIYLNLSWTFDLVGIPTQTPRRGANRNKAKVPHLSVATYEKTSISKNPLTEMLRKTSLTMLSSQDWINSRESDSYTLQLIGVSTEQAAIKYIQQYKGLKELHVFKHKRNNGQWFSVIYGNYESKAEALRASKNLSTARGSVRPWARRMGAIQQDLFR
jgi:septal ring-binding cell division protein DamX